MAWALVLGVLGVVHAVNAMAPRKGNPVVFGWSFFVWLTIELIWHHIVIGALLAAWFVSAGALDQAVGVIGLALFLIAEALLIGIGLVTRRTVVTETRWRSSSRSRRPSLPPQPRGHPLPDGTAQGHQGRQERRVRQGRRQVLRLDVTVPSAPVPRGRARRPALVQIHGGGWVIGDKREQGISLLTHMAAQGWVGFNVNYRLSPGATFPDHPDRAPAWIREPRTTTASIRTSSASPADRRAATSTAPWARRSATLASSLASRTPTSVAAAVPFYGIYDFTLNGAFGSDPEIFRRFLEPIVMKAFLAEEPERYDEASPLHHVHDGVPPFFVIHGDRDTLAPVEDARVFVERMRAISKEPVLYAEMQGAQHAFEVFPCSGPPG